MLKNFKRPLVFILILFLIPFYFIASVCERSLICRMHEYSEGDRICDIRGHIIKKEIKNEKYRYTMSLSKKGMISKRRGLLISEDQDLPVDATIVFDCEYMLISPAENEGCFDAEKYYAARGISFVAKLAEVHQVRKGFFGYDILNRVQSAVSEYYRRTLFGEESGLLSAMALGDKGALDEDAKQLFSDAGLAHLLAVSGLHISIVGMGLYRLLRKKGMSYEAAGVLSLFVVGCYGMMTGLSTSTLRAVIMFAVMTGGEILAEAYDVGSAAALSAMIILVASPTSLFDTGFLFSFGAVFGIVYVADPLRRSYETVRKNRFGPDYMPPKLSAVEMLASMLIFGSGLQLFVLPIIAISNHSFSPYVIILNILLIPFMGLLIGWGLFFGLLGAGAMAVFGVVLPAFFMLPCHCILYVYEMVSEFALTLPKAMITVGQPQVWQIVLYYFLLVVAVRMVSVNAAKYTPSKGGTFGRYARHAAPVALMALSFFILTHVFFRETEIDMLSVGQGDGLCIMTSEGEVYMVDGGSSSTDELAKYTLLPFLKYKGIDHVTFWFITHLDADHYNGMMELLSEGFGIDHIVLAKSVEKNEAYYEMLSYCKNSGTDVLYMEAGDVCGTDSMKLTCLFPEYPSGFSGTNENSLCLRLDYGDFNMVFTGDMGTEQEEAVLAEKLVSGNIEVLKSAHHGSKNSNCACWLDTVDPKLCIISAGRHNLYHHPSPDTLRRLDERGIPHLCTIDVGRIRILPEMDGRFAVETAM